MHWLAHWLRWSYPDDRLAWLARQAVAADPRLVNLTQMSITCTHGVIRLTGRVPHAWDRAHIEVDIDSALHRADLPYRCIVNQLYVP